MLGSARRWLEETLLYWADKEDTAGLLFRPTLSTSTRPRLFSLTADRGVLRDDVRVSGFYPLQRQTKVRWFHRDATFG